MKRFNSNWVALGLLGTAYLFSIYHFTKVSRATADHPGEKVLRIVHWQLEPGFREGLQWAIDQYNQLPHVKEQHLRVEQQGVTERVYGQFINIHLISGTAPDLMSKGMSQLIKDNAVARFFTPVSDYITEPNPYNAPDKLPEGLDPKLKKMLSTSPWSDTFVDGMKGGYDDKLNEYYAIPISTYGSLRVFYNDSLVAEAKAFVRRAFEQEPRPAWLEGALRTADNPRGVTPDRPALHQWLATEEVPQTLGQMLLLCEAVQQISQEPGRELLVPISGSNYGPSDLGSSIYQRLILKGYGKPMDLDYSLSVDGFEVAQGWQNKDWSFDDKAYQDTVKMQKRFAEYYPPGFLGLDREQAQRRFVQGNAMMMASGGWDAAGIFKAVEHQSPERTFPVTVTVPPSSVEGEIWYPQLADKVSEADFKAGVPLAINKQSPLREEALDFLHFITSFNTNQEMNRRTGWLPVVVGAEPTERMRPFRPNVVGVPPGLRLDITGESVLSQIRTAAKGNFKLMLTGDIDYDQYTEIVNAAFADPRLGANRQWYDKWQWANDQTSNFDQSVNVEDIRQYLLDDDTADRRRRGRLYQALEMDRGYWYRKLWKDYHPDEPFPSIK